MTDELAKRLKLIASKLMGRMAVDGVEVNATCDQAADHLKALSAEVERLTENAKANNQLARMYKAQADEFRAKYVAAVGQD
jgi:outer membrane murein-binding lipoprotein Lpp